MKLLQFGDLHHDPSTRVNTTKAMADLLRLARQECPDVIVNTGDLVMKRGSVLPAIALELRQFHCALAEVAPVLVIQGNHDLPAMGDGTGSVAGVLGSSAARDGIHCVETPRVVTVGGMKFCCLPYPARSVGPDGKPLTPEQLADGLLDIIRAMNAEAPGAPLVFHGTVSGAAPGTESGMGFDTGMTIHEAQIPSSVPFIMAGHIHKPQTVGRAVYAGSPTALSFGEEQHGHGAVVWEQVGDRWVSTQVTLEPELRYWTLDLRQHEDPVAHLDALMERKPGLTLASVVCRVLFRAKRGANAMNLSETIRRRMQLLNVHTLRLVPELVPDDRPAGDVLAFEDPSAMLVAWADANGITDPEELRQLKLVDQAASEETAGRSSEIVNRGSYRLTGASWVNWKSLGSGSWTEDQLGRLVCIEGENASGKSNLAEVEAFALWGKTPRGRVALGDLPRRGTTSCVVDVTITHASGTWRVRRQVTVNAKGVGSSALAVLAQDGDGWKPVDMQAADAQRFVEDMVGTWDLYLSTRYASQGDVDRLLSLKPAELKDVLQQAMALEVYSEREAWAGRMESTTSAAYAQLQTELRVAREACDAAKERIQAVVESMVNATRDRADSMKHLAELELEQASLESQAVDASERLAIIKHQQAEFEGRQKKLRDAIATLEDRRREESRAVDAMNSASRQKDSVAHQISEVDGKLQALPLSVDEDAALDEAVRTRQAHQRIADDGKVAMDALGDRHRVQGEEWLQKLQDRAQVERAAHAKLVRLEADFKGARMVYDAQKQAAERAASSVEGVLFGDKCAACPLACDGMEAKARLLTLVEPDGAALEEAKRELDVVCAASDEIKAQRSAVLTAMKDEWDAEGARWQAEIAKARLAASAAEGVHAEAAAVQKKRTALQSEKTALLAQLESIGLRIDDATAAWKAAGDAVAVALEAKLDAVVSAGESSAQALAVAEDTLAQIRNRRQACDAALVREREQLARIDREISHAQGKTESLREDAKMPAGLFDKCEAARMRLEAVQRYRRAMGRDGIPYLKVEDSIGRLQEWANGFLGAGELRLFIESSRQTQAGERKDEVVARYSNRFGGHELSAASGFERIALGYAMRAAMAQLQASARGIRVSHWIADEGWGAFDESNLIVGQQMLERMGAEFERVFFISHVSAIREVADTKLSVTVDTTNGSEVLLSR